ncbi:glycoside hydrolase family 66 protein [Bacillus sp. NEB1478]|uniref:glycoside hydrolase family 66 protein n=1 Tax=Bacillus sp. NEB1478 TaxID=3073816 RepID=UPI002872DC7B|nr:glycoside hydrolase family 66 protein [Bacillus sp. NEB1478]WNB92363.1 glycoside hydrolase family 66 protein [Bacillus sp. NEB1478]
MMKKLVLFAGVMILLAACSSKSAVVEVDENKEQKTYVSSIETDKAVYKPGDTVLLKVNLKRDLSGERLQIRYRFGNKIVKEEEKKLDKGKTFSWKWKPPAQNEKGYMVEVLLKKGKDYVDHVNVAVDVSEDWSKFPRYGYLADFEAMDKTEQEEIMKRLNRYHINGIQFYDWQYKHHQPLPSEGSPLQKEWPDIANRPVSHDTVQNYIDLSHKFNMKAMNYNLLFGAYEGAEKEGVKPEWGLYQDSAHETQDFHPLPDSWASNIMLQDPANKEWQSFLIEKEQEVFSKLPFDGWHVDQLGDRGMRWNYDGEITSLEEGYVSFLEEAKKQLNVPLVMNAVNQYGQINISQKAPVDFLYTEVWEPYTKYSHLKQIIDQNNNFSGFKKNTVLAAYMNYDLSNSLGEFNTPAVLLTNAVIFSSGGSHLELGENMLSKEYFPHKKLEITEKLKKQLISYYDFLTGYQNFLRDGVKPSSLEVRADSLKLSPEFNKVEVYYSAYEKANNEIVHLINFSDASTMDWQDNEGIQAEPKEKKEIELDIFTDKKVEKVWMASPDQYLGSPLSLDFKQKNDKMTVTLPSLKYWDMLVIEYAK